jgi:hypothetical protein
MSPSRINRILKTFLLSLSCLLGSMAWAANDCAFNAAGQLVNSPVQVENSGGKPDSWGGIGGTGIRQALASDPKDGWGGIGGTGVKPAQMASDPKDGWGGVGGTGVTRLPQSLANNENWGGIGGTGISHAPAVAQSHLAGIIQFVRGTVLAQQGSLPVRKLARGDAVCEGDAITTRDGMLQIRMADQGRVMLYADSRLHVDTFRLPNPIDGSERLAMTLEQGGMRAMTGEIGHVNKANYLIQTPQAQIHIRGTDHEVYFVPESTGRFSGVPAGTYNHVLRGGTTLSDAQGSVRLDPSQSGFAPLSTQAPAQIGSLPAVLRSMPVAAAHALVQSSLSGSSGIGNASTSSSAAGLGTLPDVIASDNINLNLYSNPVAAAPQSGYVGSTTSYSYNEDGSFNGEVSSVNGLNGNEDSMNQIQLDPDSQLPRAVFLADGTLVFYATEDTWLTQLFQANVDGVPVAWGIYSNGVSSDSSGDWQYVDYHHFVYTAGGATPMSVLQSLSGTFTYASVVGSTTPTSEYGAMGGQLNSMSISMQMGANPGVTHYAVDVTDGNQRHWNGSYSGFVSLSDFKSGKLSLTGSCDSSYCGAGIAASGQASGVVIGAHGKGVITAYGMQTQQGDMVNGVAVLTRP